MKEGGITLRSSIVLLLVLASMAPSLAARPAGDVEHAEEEGLPSLLSGGGEGGGWLTLVLELDGSPLDLEVLALDVQGRLQVALFLYAGDRLVEGRVTTAFPGETGARVASSGAAPGLHVRHDVRAVKPEHEDAAGETYRINDPESGDPLLGEVRILVWMSGDHVAWRYDLRSGPGNAVLGLREGSEAFLFTGRDFVGPASTWAMAFRYGAYAVVEGRTELDVRGSLMGVFLPTWGPAVRDMRVVGPGGERECPCWFTAVGENAAGAGAYGFGLSLLAAGDVLASDVVLGGADVEWPAGREAAGTDGRPLTRPLGRRG